MSDEPKHTPGPWTFEPVEEDATFDHPAFIIRGTRATDRSKTRRDTKGMPPAMQKVAYIYSPTVPIGVNGGQKVSAETMAEAIANTRLIAAGPDLLAALQAIAYTGCGEDDYAWNAMKPAVNIALAAIAKAEGVTA